MIKKNGELYFSHVILFMPIVFDLWWRLEKHLVYEQEEKEAYHGNSSQEETTPATSIAQCLQPTGVYGGSSAGSAD